MTKKPDRSDKDDIIEFRPRKPMPTKGKASLDDQDEQVLGILSQTDFQSPSEENLCEFVEKIGSFDFDPSESLIKLAGSEDPDIRARAFAALLLLPLEETREFAYTVIEDPKSPTYVKDAAYIMLCAQNGRAIMDDERIRSHSPALLNSLLHFAASMLLDTLQVGDTAPEELLCHSTEEDFCAMVATFAQMKDPRAIDVLFDILDCVTYHVAFTIAQTIWQYNSSKVAPLLLALEKHPDSNVREAAAKSKKILVNKGLSLKTTERHELTDPSLETYMVQYPHQGITHAFAVHRGLTGRVRLVMFVIHQRDQGLAFVTGEVLEDGANSDEKLEVLVASTTPPDIKTSNLDSISPSYMRSLVDDAFRFTLEQDDEAPPAFWFWRNLLGPDMTPYGSSGLKFGFLCEQCDKKISSAQIMDRMFLEIYDAELLLCNRCLKSSKTCVGCKKNISKDGYKFHSRIEGRDDLEVFCTTCASERHFRFLVESLSSPEFSMTATETLTLAFALEGKRQYQEAFLLLERLLYVYPQRVEINYLPTVNLLLKQCERLGDYKAAVKAQNALIHLSFEEEEPVTPKDYRILGRYQALSGDVELGMKTLSDLLATNERDYGTHREIASLLFKLGRTDEALKSINSSIALAKKLNAPAVSIKPLASCRDKILNSVREKSEKEAPILWEE